MILCLVCKRNHKLSHSQLLYNDSLQTLLEIQMRLKLWDQSFKQLTPWDAILIKLARWQLSRTRQKSIIANYPEIAAYTRDYIGMDISLYGYWEIHSLKTLEILCQRYSLCDTFIDIGANIGAYSLGLGKNFSNIIAFEPDPETHSLLSHNLRFNLDCAYSSNQLALGNRKYNTKLKLMKSNRGGASLMQNDSECDKVVNVEVETLDNFLKKDQAEQKTKNIDLLKIDVEGFESDVIQGAVNTIKDHQPIVAFEWSNQSLENHSHTKILDDLGYKFFLTKKEHWLKTAMSDKKRGCISLCPIERDKLNQKKQHINLVIALPSKYIN